MRNIINDFQNSDTWKNQLTIAINFISLKHTEEEHVMHSRNNNIKFTFYNDTNEVVVEPFESLRSRYQGNLETSMRWSDFIFDSYQLRYYKCHKVNIRHGGSSIDSPDWTKKNKQQKIPKIKIINTFNMR